MKQHYH